MPYIANPLEGIPLVNTFITDQSLLGTTPATDDVLIIFDQSATALKQLTISELQDSITASVSGLTDTTITSIASGEVLKWNGSAWINQTLAEANILPVAGPTFTGVLTVGSAVISEADLELIDDLTAGTVVVSKAVTVDGNKDVGTIRNLTIDGVFTDGNYSFDTSGNVTGLGTIGSGNITSTGTVQGTTITATTAFVPDASDGAALGTASLEFSDLFLADAAVISLGDDDDVTLTHVVDTGILLSSTDRFQFGDAGTFIHQSADGVLTIESDTTVDINGAVVFDGALTGITTIASGTHTIGTLVVAAASITDTSGALSFGNENLTTTGTLAAGTTTIGTLTVAAASITDSSGAITFGNENLATTGTLAAGTTTIGSLVVAAASITDTSGAITFGDENLTSTGVITGLTVEATGDTAADDNAAMGYTSAEGLILTGQGSTNDVTIKNDADTTVMSIPTGATGVTFAGTIGSGAITSTGIVTGTGFTAGNAVLAEAELELLDDLTPGTAIASKVVTTDASIDTTGQRNLTITGELDAATGDFSGAVDIAGALTLSGADMDVSNQNLGSIKTATFALVNAGSAGSGTIAVDWRNGMKQVVTATGNITLTFTAPAGPCNVMLKIIHSGGGRTITWGDSPTPIMWPSGTAPTLAGAAGIDVVAFFYDGTNFYGSASVLFS